MIRCGPSKETIIAVLLLAAFCLPFKADAQKAVQTTTLVIQGGTLIDATGRPPVEDAVIVIERGRIKSVGKRGGVSIPKGSRIISAKGKTILPGFIDGHCHLVDFMGELYLHLGVTTCPDISLNDDYWTVAQREGTNLGKIRGPRLWSGGRWLAGSPPAWAEGGGRRDKGTYLFKTAEEARKIVREKKELGVDYIKLTEFLTPEMTKAAADEAHRLGLPVTAHNIDVFLAAENGFAGVEHHWAPGMTSISDLEKRWKIHQDRASGKIDTADLAFYYESENFDKIIQVMVEKNISWSPTIATWFRPLSASAKVFKQSELSILDDPKAKYLPLAVRAQTLGQYERYEKFSAEKLVRVREGYKKIEDFMRRFVKAGGIIRGGSDPNNGLPALGLHEELKMFVEAGLSPMEAIRSATINVARTFGKERDFGTVEVGKVADLVVIEGDPLRDIWATQNVKMVVLNGEVVDINFHPGYRNPIPSPDPWRSTPSDIEISPRSIPQGSGPVVLKVRARRGLEPFHKVTLNGKELETRFVSRSELEATVSREAVKQAGLYTVMVVGPGEFASRSSPVYLVVPFKKK